MNCELTEKEITNFSIARWRIKEGKIIMAKLRASTFFFYHITRNCFSAAPLSLSNSTKRERDGGRKKVWFTDELLVVVRRRNVCVCALAYHLFNSVIAVFLIIMAALELRAHLQVGKVPV
jgi:hypothetical protein